jgi:hypothetical protein
MKENTLNSCRVSAEGLLIFILKRRSRNLSLTMTLSASVLLLVVDSRCIGRCVKVDVQGSLKCDADDPNPRKATRDKA